MRVGRTLLHQCTLYIVHNVKSLNDSSGSN